MKSARIKTVPHTPNMETVRRLYGPHHDNIVSKMKIIPHTVDMKTVRPLYGPHNDTVSTPKKSPPAKKRKYQKRKRVKSGKKLLPIT